MKLYITPGSPYARMTRIMVLEKRLQDRVEIEVARTRTAGSPYYQINPSGRVPYLLRDDGVGLEESSVICRYLDHLEGNPQFELPDGEPGWEARRLGARAISLGRETGRPPNEQSPTIVAHEIARAGRLADLWESEINHPWMWGELNMAQLALVCALGLEARYRDFRWREGHPKLVEWFSRMSKRPAMAQTAPPAGH
jgi:glutathione S-transferase